MSTDGELIPLAERQRWEEALSEVDHAFGHTWTSCRAMQLTTGCSTYLYRYSAGDAYFVCPIAERTYCGETDVVTPYGFSGFAGRGSVPQLLAAWSRFARRRGYVAGYIALNPLLAGDRFTGSEGFAWSSDLFFLDLARGEDRLLEDMTYRRRRPLMRWEREGAPLLTDRAVLAPFFRKTFATFMGARGAGPAYAFFDDTLLHLTGDPRAILLGQGSIDQIEAVALFCHTDSIGEFMFAVSSDGGRGHTDVLVWAGAREMKRRKVRWMSLGGGVAPGDGIEAVKRGYGGLALRKPVLRQVFDPARFVELCRKAEADPGDRTGYFPPYRRRACDVH